jgi:hypothetical protein
VTIFGGLKLIDEYIHRISMELDKKGSLLNFIGSRGL